MKNKLLSGLLLLVVVAISACEKEEEDPYGAHCEAPAGTICTTIGTTAMSGPAIWRRVGTQNRFRIDFQSGNQNVEIDIYVPDSVLYGNTYTFKSDMSTNSAVFTFYDGTDEWMATSGDVTITSTANDLVTGTFFGIVTKDGSTETMTVKSSSISSIPKQ